MSVGEARREGSKTDAPDLTRRGSSDRQETREAAEASTPQPQRAEGGQLGEQPQLVDRAVGCGYRPKVAVVVTEYRFNSHADMILGRLLGDLDFEPRLDVAAVYTDQVPANDMSREMAAKRGVPIYSTVAETVRAAHLDTPIDGVIFVGEHGDYPVNALGQKEYPRYRLFREIIEELDALGLKVPIFHDKHFSYDLNESLWMFEALRERRLPFLGGSTIPLTEPSPAYDPALLRESREWLAISYSASIEAYGYHGLELMQSLAEKRLGGESGVSAVWAVQGDAVWTAMDEGRWPEDLMHEALRLHPGVPDGHPRTWDPNPVLFAVEYVDGSRGYCLQFLRGVSRWGYAFRSLSGTTAAICLSGEQRPFSHFERMTKLIENLVYTGQSPVPVERVYVSTGLIGYGMQALHTRGRVETPLLHVQYGE